MAITLQKRNNQFLIDNDFPKTKSVTLSDDVYGIDTFKSKIRDLVRPNRFAVYFEPPSIIAADIDTAYLTTMVKKISVPSLTVNEYVYKRAGKKIHIPLHTEFTDFSITFYNDIDINARNSILYWQRTTINNWEQNYLGVPLIALSGSVIFFQLDGSNTPINSTRFTNCWPKGIQGMEFGHDLDSQIGEFTVDFTYTEQEFTIIESNE